MKARNKSWLRADMIYVRYSTMDNVDGKQARRTGQSSGLGELFEYVYFIRGLIE